MSSGAIASSILGGLMSLVIVLRSTTSTALSWHGDRGEDLAWDEAKRMAQAATTVTLATRKRSDRLKPGPRTGALWGGGRHRGDPVAPMFALEMLGFRDLTPGSQRYPAGLSYLMSDDPSACQPWQPDLPGHARDRGGPAQLHHATGRNTASIEWV